MTSEQKIEQLTNLLSTVIFALEMTQYDIDDATESHNVVVKADQFHQQMIDILHTQENN